MYIIKLYNKWIYYKHMANKRPASVFCNTRPSVYLTNYLIYKERAAWLLTSGKSFNSSELNMLYEMTERPQPLHSEEIKTSNVSVQFFNTKGDFYA